MVLTAFPNAKTKTEISLDLLFLYKYLQFLTQFMFMEHKSGLLIRLLARYLDDLWNNDNPYFEGMVSQICPPELHLNKANITDAEVPFWIYIFLLQMDLFLLKFMINTMTLFMI